VALLRVDICLPSTSSQEDVERGINDFMDSNVEYEPRFWSCLAEPDYSEEDLDDGALHVKLGLLCVHSCPNNPSSAFPAMCIFPALLATGKRFWGSSLKCKAKGQLLFYRS